MIDFLSEIPRTPVSLFFPPPEASADRMHRDLRLSVVIPCYNEEDGVREVIGRIPKFVDEIVVVDNNCTDRTAEVATSLGARVVFEKRAGYGAAYKAGLAAATGDVVITMDGKFLPFRVW